MSASPRDGRFPATLQESCAFKPSVLVANHLAMVPSGDSAFVLVGPLLAKVHPELPHQGSASGFVSPAATAEAPVLTVSTLLPMTTQVWLSTPLSTLFKIRDLPVSLAVTAEASVSPTSLAVVSVPPMGVGAIPAKEVAPVKTASAKGLL